MSKVVEFIAQRLRLNGCRIEEKDNQIVVWTPDIFEHVVIIHLKDEQEYAALAQLLNGRTLVQETRYIAEGTHAALIEIDVVNIRL